MKKVHFIGIAGKAMAPLAKAFKDLGWQVTGSDQEKVYPPISTYLEENDIAYFRGYQAGNIPSDADFFVVGRSALIIDPYNPEYESALNSGHPVYSYPEILQKYLIKKNSIVVAGTYGKTTISAILAWILQKAGLNPSYMTGGIPLNLKDGLKITDSDYSVVEGDEPPSLKNSDPPKFMFYQPKYLILTATKYDHPEIFKNKEEYLKAFVALVKLIPPDGLLVYNLDSVDEAVLKEAKCRKVSYSFDHKKASYFIKSFSVSEEITSFIVQTPEGDFPFKTTLLGKYNLENICVSVVISREINIKDEVVKGAIEEFKGIKTRLEFLGKIGGRLLYWDFSQHPLKVKVALQALKEHYPKEKIICVFDPSMTGLKFSESLSWYAGAFDQADQVVVGKVKFLKEIPKEKRVTGKDISEAIFQTQKKVFYEPVDEKILSFLMDKTKTGDVIVFMSSGGLRFTNLIAETIKELSHTCRQAGIKNYGRKK
ncbi:hypothetical protein COS54_01295 [Candidatus Shapirobacteria bacterium CG03_land_8_20_14_0_80_39_12]|uniref:UDP-N-acetylmuramate:L-alanyl-gamma-D-glutamyl-meso-diaminopimelate ligase n=1 Tax=Candidatus Shapirobacteria bacterium CG03_land_8_20_14_0_80_39_12 TaxID=1974879 RepID=A0A2M7BDV5_9BACT|nr:MAG: hypothetical protein COS54_01295 [Candidatus Shapirobacteria bacterium CG03_land_8_20_14_0_80_39_12]